MAAADIAADKAAHTEDGHTTEGKRRPAEADIGFEAARHSAGAEDTGRPAEEHHFAARQRVAGRSAPADFDPEPGLSTHRTGD